jgi:hypothetical protein
MTTAEQQQPISFTKMKFGRRTFNVSDMAEASRLFREAVGDRGSSAVPNGILLDSDGRQVGYVSYNGRVWRGTGYVAGQDALYCPSGFLGDPQDLSRAYRKASEILGWRWSAAHGGYISESHRSGPEWQDYFVAQDTEDACFQDGIETFEQARDLVAKHADDAAEASMGATP